jgi:predicted phage terminase large subunit-like protein
MGEQSDPAVIITIAVNSQKDIFITNIVRDWYNPDQFIDKVLEIAQVINPIKFGIETISFQKTLKFFLDKEKAARRLHVNIVEVKRSAHVAKAERIKRIQPYAKAGQIYLCKDSEQFTEEQEAFLEELDSFPYGRYDDILDALADAIEIHHAPSTRLKHRIEYQKVGEAPYGTGYRHKAVIVPYEERYPTTNGVSS